MRCTATLQWTLVGLSVLGVLLPAPWVLAAEGATSGNGPETAAPDAQVVAVDVALRPGGFLPGQAVDVQGAPLANKRVSIHEQGRQIATTSTDAAGYFLVRDLRGGTYEIAVGDVRGVFRLWASGTAPPSAEGGALLVAGKGPVRGQSGPIGFWLSKPWVVAGAVAAAVAVPAAMHNHRVARLSSP